ncbi:nitroreductase family protein [Halanaerobium sp. ST460_2HS_T2]|uniref:nitroreductase family protein n=1 Tax=Halanaerobium sp. ST460_2HS_T2 TaxID=2183914 RepID=UPI000DF39AF6|nr:nitroreductase family protein [Halanaerobium sp. ST460_2HS_T2]RCW52401.1 nitroreductase [Halanaerobium sp. ST460_2HS_T2]
MSNETIKNIKERRSVRKYIDKKIPEEILEEIIDCARLAPTGNNKQAWTFLVITDDEIKNKIASFTRYGRFIREAGACIAVFVNQEKATTPLQDASAATENIMIAAKSYDLGTCWVNSYQKEHSKKIKELVNCPQDRELMTLMSIGYYKEDDVNMPSKKSLSEVMVLNKF